MLGFGNLKVEIKGGIHVKGKTVISIIMAVTVIGVILTWFWLQDVITEYDLDTTQPSEQITEVSSVNQHFV